MSTPPTPLRTELKVLIRELDEAQHMIDHARKTFPGKFRFVQAMLNRRQLILDSQRIRVNAAMEYLDATEN